jgi:hypothetical protein
MYYAGIKACFRTNEIERPLPSNLRSVALKRASRKHEAVSGVAFSYWAFYAVARLQFVLMLSLLAEETPMPGSIGRWLWRRWQTSW